MQPTTAKSCTQQAQTHTCTLTHADTRPHTHRRIHAHTHTHAHARTRTHTHMHAHAHTRTCTQTRTRTLTLTHSLPHAHTHARPHASHRRRITEKRLPALAASGIGRSPQAKSAHAEGRASLSATEYTSLEAPPGDGSLSTLRRTHAAAVRRAALSCRWRGDTNARRLANRSCAIVEKGLNGPAARPKSRRAFRGRRRPHARISHRCAGCGRGGAVGGAAPSAFSGLRGGGGCSAVACTSSQPIACARVVPSAYLSAHALRMCASLRKRACVRACAHASVCARAQVRAHVRARASERARVQSRTHRT
jgi:hypothetical protein